MVAIIVHTCTKKEHKKKGNEKIQFPFCLFPFFSFPVRTAGCPSE